MEVVQGACYRGRGKVLIEKKSQQPLASGHVRIQPAFVGLCGTDAHILHGHMDARVPNGTVIGHEMSGWVKEVSQDVDVIAIGQLVTVRPAVACGTCTMCRSGYGNVCSSLTVLGIDADGALQTDWVVPSDLVHSASGILPQRAALAEPLAVAVHDVRRSRLGRSDKCLVVGAGPIGVAIALVARNMGAYVTLVDVNPRRVQMAQELGLHSCEPNNLTDELFDHVFEVSGSGAGIECALERVRPRGTITIVGIQTSPAPLSLFQVFWKEVTIMGARLYTADDFESALSILREPSFPAESLITDVISLDDVPHADSLITRDSSMKIIVNIGAGVV